MIPESPGEIAFSLGSFSLHWYGIALAFAAIVGVAVALRLGSQTGFKREDIIDAALLSVFAGFIGARIWHVWNEWWWYGDKPFEIWRVWEGGLALHGGIAFGLITLFFYTKRKKISLVQFLDFAVVGMIAAQAIGRIGNYFNQELFGKPSDLPWAILISPEHRPVEFAQFTTFHPLFLYEMLLNASLFLLLFFVIWKKFKGKPGVTLSAYFIGYGIIRFSLDFFRFDQFGFWGLTAAQWASIVMVCCGLIFFIRVFNKVTPRSSLQE